MAAHPLPVIPGVFYGTLEGEAGGLPYGNVFCFTTSATTVTAPLAEARALTIATSLANQWGTHMMGDLHTSYSGSTARVYALAYPTSPAQEFTAINSGGSAGGPAGATVAALIKHTVHRRGRGSQARSYVGPLVASQVDANQREMIPAAQASYTTNFNAFLAGVIADYTGAYPSDSILYSQLSRVGAGATYPISSSACEVATGYQRRRARRRSI